jgi:hypothetical protein
MSSNPTELKVETPNPSRSRSERCRPGIRQVMSKSSVVHTRFISSAADNLPVNWTIGSKPNVSSPVRERFNQQVRPASAVASR